MGWKRVTARAQSSHPMGTHGEDLHSLQALQYVKDLHYLHNLQSIQKVQTLRILELSTGCPQVIHNLHIHAQKESLSIFI